MEDQPVTYYQILITDGKVGLPSLPVTADVYSMSGDPARWIFRIRAYRRQA